MEEEKMSGLGKESGGRPAGKVLQDEEKVVMPGFRFHPTDEELVGFYLKRKVEKKLFSIDVIKQIDIYKYNPWDLPVASTVGEMEWYFFCLRGRKYRNSIRPNRVTGSGFWKATGIDRPIYSADESGECIGLKKSLVYYRGSAGKGTKTDWMMHEFRLPSNAKNSETISPSMQEAEIWTICRIFKRNLCHKKYTRQDWKGSSSKQTPADTESKTSSFESDNGDDHKCYGASYIQQGENIVTNYFVEKNQPYASQWNPMVQAPLSTLFPNIPSATTNEFVKDENWDELGRITGFMNDQAMSDPAYVYDCRYTQEEYSKVAEEDHLDSMRMIHRRYQISIGHVLNLIAWLITLGPCRSGYLSARCGAIMHEGIDVTHYFL